VKVILGAVEAARRQVDLDAGEGRHLFAVLLDAGHLLLHDGNGTVAARHLKEALELIEAPGMDLTVIEIGETHQRLGMALDIMDDEAGAAEQFAIALEILEGAEEQHRDSIAHLANNLGMIRRNQGDYAKASELYREAQEIFEELGESHALDLATVCNNQGSLFWAWGQPELSRDFHLTALKLRRDNLPDSHPDIGQSACNLAAVYHDIGDFEKAGRNYERALGIFKRSLSEDPETYEIVSSNLAELLEQSGQPAKAEKLRKKTASLVRKARKKDNNEADSTQAPSSSS
jgi:tetratricopeptide (TPR) repeat protein